jgi:putative ABC transport system permease protein
MVTPGYFRTFGIRLVSGRQISDQDTPGGMRVAMVNETFVKLYLPTGEPLGQRIIINPLVPGNAQTGPEVEWRIIGVFHDTRDGLRSEVMPVAYVSFWQNPWPRASVGVRTTSEPQGITRSLAASINSIDPDLPLAGVRTMDDVLNDTLAFDRFGMVLFGSFAALALLLASIGMYGVMAFTVVQRVQEFGIRSALGASGGNILRLVLREGLVLALLGLGLGSGGAYLVGRAMQSTLFGVGALDVIALGGVALVLMAATLLACYIPARRASRVDPMVALRCS